jgi:hypothetical protein
MEEREPSRTLVGRAAAVWWRIQVWRVVAAPDLKRAVLQVAASATAVAVLFAASVIAIAPPVDTYPVANANGRYVVLGDSFSSGEGAAEGDASKIIRVPSGHAYYIEGGASVRAWILEQGKPTHVVVEHERDAVDYVVAAAAVVAMLATLGCLVVSSLALRRSRKDGAQRDAVLAELERQNERLAELASREPRGQLTGWFKRRR